MGRPKKEVGLDVAKATPKLPTFDINGRTYFDISNRLYLTYEFANGRVLTINNPKGIHVTPSGINHIVTKDNLFTIVSPTEGWFIHWSDFIVDQPTAF